LEFISIFAKKDLYIILIAGTLEPTKELKNIFYKCDILFFDQSPSVFYKYSNNFYGQFIKTNPYHNNLKSQFFIGL